jgi:transmembrane protein EpsG
MTFYLLFLFLITLLVTLAYLFPAKSKIFEICLLLLAVSISGFRNNLSGDFRSYVSWYIYKTRDFDFEFGFVWVMNLFRWLNCSYHFLFFFFSLCTVLFVFFGIKKYTAHSNLAFLFFLLIPALYLNTWSIIRQSFAISIAFYAFYFLTQKRYLIYIALMSIGISIHYTAIVPFLVFFVVYKCADKIKMVHLVVLLLFTLVLSQLHWVTFFASFFEESRYLFYFSNGRTSVNNYKIIVLNVLAIFLLFYFKKMKKAYPIQKYVFILCFFSILITNLLATANHLNRFSNYFTIFQIVVFSDLIFFELKNKRFVMFGGLYIYGISLFLYTIKADYNLNMQETKYIPYDSIFYKFDDPFFMMGTDYLIDPTLAKEIK